MDDGMNQEDAVSKEIMNCVDSVEVAQGINSGLVNNIGQLILLQNVQKKVIKSGKAMTIDSLKKFCNYNLMNNDTHEKIDKRICDKKVEDSSDFGSDKSEDS